jgi:Zn-dependent peptidase ImmA (M78 family)
MDQTDYIRAEASQLSKQQISALAESIAHQLSFEPCGDIIATVKKLGGKVEVEETLLKDPEKSGSLFVRSGNDFTIIVPTHTSPSRDRFTIAHELGHFIVHYLWRQRHHGLQPFKMMALRKDSDRVEWEANWFAAAFLMPSGIFRERFQLYGGNIDLVASAFCVSQAAAEIRARSLGLNS